MADLNQANYQTVWADSFDDPKNSVFANHWGPAVDLSTPGQITLHTTADNQDSGAMQLSSGPSSNQGYGLYTETLQMQGTIGVYGMAGWPASDNWPGPEIDMVEILPDGTPYGTLHWKGADGSNQYKSVMFDGVDVTQKHTYQMDWQADHISFYVDGKEMGTLTDHIPLDYAHGGENESMGIGVQTSWNDGALGGKNWITIYDASYATKVSDAVAPGTTTAAPATTAPSSSTTPVSDATHSTTTTTTAGAVTDAAASSTSDGVLPPSSTTTASSDPAHATSVTTSTSGPVSATGATDTGSATTDSVHTTPVASPTTGSASPTTTTTATAAATADPTTTDAAPVDGKFDFAHLARQHGGHAHDAWDGADVRSSSPLDAQTSSINVDSGTTYDWMSHHDQSHSDHVAASSQHYAHHLI